MAMINTSLSPPLSPIEWLNDVIPLDFSTTCIQTTNEKCGYRTGKCNNIRVLKRNGTYHKLCDFHREKANWNQKKLDHKKRLKKTIGEIQYEQASIPISIDQPPNDWISDEVDFFCQVMTPVKPKPLELIWSIPPTTNDIDKNQDDGAELDLLFKAEVMVLVDQCS